MNESELETHLHAHLLQKTGAQLPFSDSNCMFLCEAVSSNEPAQTMSEAARRINLPVRTALRHCACSAAVSNNTARFWPNAARPAPAWRTRRFAGGNTGNGRFPTHAANQADSAHMVWIVAPPCTLSGSLLATRLRLRPAVPVLPPCRCSWQASWSAGAFFLPPGCPARGSTCAGLRPARFCHGSLP